MSDLMRLFDAEEKSRRWHAECENASARRDLALIDERCARLISQHEPVALLGIDRERLRLVLNYLRHGDLARLDREFTARRIAEVL